MGPEILSTARPTRLRLAGFLTITFGGLLIGLGSTLTWATVEPFETPTKGIDLWEGKIALLAGAAVLVSMVIMRLLLTVTARRAVAVLILALGLLAAILAGLDAATASSRFTNPGQRDRIARVLARELGEPYARVRGQLEAVSRRFEVRLGPGIFLALAGGALAAAGGGLSIVWAGRWRPTSRPAGETHPATDAPEGSGEAGV